MPPEFLKPLTKPFIGSGWPRYAGFWRRLLACLVDFLLVGVPVVAVWMWLLYGSGSRAAALVGCLLFSLADHAYEVFFHARWGQTIGKMVARIEVRTLDGFPIFWKDALLRSAVGIGFTLVFALGLAAALLEMPAHEYAGLDWRAASRRLNLLNPVPEWVRHASNVWYWSEVVVLLFNRKKRALHDYIAGTVVMHCRKAQEDREDSSNE